MTPSTTTEPGAAYERYRGDVYGWAYRLLGRHHDALDVAQDVFLRWLRQTRREVPRHPRGWLRQVTINRALDLLRSRRAEPARTRSGPPPPAPNAPGGAETEELRADIAAALATLTDAQRCVLIAKVHDGMTFAAIAAEQHLAVSTAKTHYLRALSAVRHRLAARWAPQRSD